MKDLIVAKRRRAARRAHRVRARVSGTASCPRLSIKRSLKHIYAQLIDDVTGRTLAAAGDHDVEPKGKTLETAKAVGTLLGEKKEKGVGKQAVGDRGSYRYHGRVQALVEAAGAAGLSYTK